MPYPFPGIDRRLGRGHGDGMAQVPHTVRRWSRVEYERLVELGVFDGDPVELIGGQLVVAEPHGTYHAAALGAAHEVLAAALPRGWIIRAQLPVSLDHESSPEPDLAVVRGRHADYREAHPMVPPLVIEVSDSSLAFDRRDKGSLYARAGVPDYWIVNLVDRVLEVYRDPAPDAEASYGWRYEAVTRVAPPASVTSSSVVMATIPVSALFP